MLQYNITLRCVCLYHCYSSPPILATAEDSLGFPLTQAMTLRFFPECDRNFMLIICRLVFVIHFCLLIVCGKDNKYKIVITKLERQHRLGYIGWYWNGCCKSTVWHCGLDSAGSGWSSAASPRELGSVIPGNSLVRWAPPVSFLDRAAVKQSYALWFGPSWREERPIFPPQQVLPTKVGRDNATHLQHFLLLLKRVSVSCTTSQECFVGNKTAAARQSSAWA
jgi:hypothetical protein